MGSKMQTYLLHYSGANIFRIGGKRFMPGLNKVTEDEWAAMKDHPLLPERFSAKAGGVAPLTWVKGRSPEAVKAPVEELKTEPREVTDANPLASFNVKEAKELIETTYDLEALEQWKTLDARKMIQSAIDEQISKILTHDESDKKK